MTWMTRHWPGAPLMKQKSGSSSWVQSQEYLAISYSDEVEIDIGGGVHGGVMSPNEGDKSGEGEGRKKEKGTNHFLCNQWHRWVIFLQLHE
jgi:hypothetical protein